MNKKLIWRIVVVLLIASMLVYSLAKHETVIAIVMGALLILNCFLLVLIIKEKNRIQ
jgi:hypothetical protein